MDAFQHRRWIIILTMLIVTLVFGVRLLYIQVLNNDWKNRAEQITHHKVTIHPARGLLYDRNGEL